MNTICYRLAILFFPIALSACVTDGAFRSERARQVDLQTVYLKTIENNYAPKASGGNGQLDLVLEQYARMDEQRTTIAKSLKEADQKKLQDLRDELKHAEDDIATLKRQDAQQQSNRRFTAAQILKQENKLRKSPNDPVAEQMLADAQAKLADIQAEIESNKKELDDAIARRDQQQKSITALLNKDYTGDADDQRRRYRNGIINEFLAIADFHYYEFKNSLMSGRASSDTLLDISELLLSTATTLTGGVTAKTNLGASSTLLKGSRSAVDKNFFIQQTLAAIINGIDDRRQKDRANILEKMKLTTDQYPLSQGLSDVQLYQSRASLVAGAMAIANDSAKSSGDSETHLQNTQMQIQ